MAPQDASKKATSKSQKEKTTSVPALRMGNVDVSAEVRPAHKSRTMGGRVKARADKSDNPEITVNMPQKAYKLSMPTRVPGEVVFASIERVVEILDRRKQALSEDNITKLVDIVLNDSERASVELDLELDNAQLRADYLNSEKLLTSAQVRQLSGLSPKNKSEPASRWRRDKKLFSVANKGLELFPAFQFKDGQPNPVIKRVLSILPSDFSPWQVAFWFASGNGWLDGEAPQDCVDAPTELINAAEHSGRNVIG